MKSVLIPLICGVVMSGCSSSQSLTIEGVVYLKGSEPHTYIVIEDSSNHKKYRVLNASEFNLKDKQRESIKANVRIVDTSSSSLKPTKVEVVEISQ